MRTPRFNKFALLAIGVFLMQAAAGSRSCSATTAEAQSEHACCRIVSKADQGAHGCCATGSPMDEQSVGGSPPCVCLHAPPQPAVPPATPNVVRDNQSTDEVALPTPSIAQPLASAALGAAHHSEPLKLALFIPQWAASRAPPLL